MLSIDLNIDARPPPGMLARLLIYEVAAKSLDADEEALLACQQVCCRAFSQTVVTIFFHDY